MNPEIVTKALATFADFLMRYLMALAAVGALTMALIEACKKLFDIRTKYHFSYIKKFIDTDNEAQETSKEIQKELSLQYSYSDTFSELVHLISGIEIQKAQTLTAYERGNLLTVFSLEVENMMGKIQDAVDAAIDNPGRYPNLFIFATSGSNTSEAIKWIEICNYLPNDIDKAQDDNIMKARAEIYTRLHQLAKRKLDRLQLQISNRWANLNQLVATLLGAFILFATLLWINCDKHLDFGDLAIMFSASTIGGILSPIAKDMISWLQKVKSGV